MNKSLLVRLFLLCLCSALLSAAQVIVAQPSKVIDRCGRGVLIDAAGTRVLLLAGSPYEMGYQHGKLLKISVGRLVNRVHQIAKIAEMTNANGFTSGTFEGILEKTQPFIDRRFMDEMQGLADGAGLNLKDVQLANLFPEMFHCSTFALFGMATANSQMLHGRILDYMTEAGIQDHAVVIVAKPDHFNAFVNVGYAGLIGLVTGMSDKQITLGQMGGKGYGSWDGMPMTFLMRKALEEAGTLTEAVKIFHDTPRTCEYYYVISDSKISDARGLACTSDRFDVFEPNHSYPQLPHAVKDAVLVSAKDRYEHLAAMVRQQLGKIDSEAALDLMNRPVAMKSCLHRVLFAPREKVFWVANASMDMKDPNYAACFQPYYKYDFAELLGMINEPNASNSQIPDSNQIDMPKRIIQRSLVSMGDTIRLENVLTKAMNKEPLVFGVIGGSITEGARASIYQNQYGRLVVDWFKKMFPATPIEYVNAGIGATSSNMGTHRVDDNLLKHKPDLVICEYAVNDRGNSLVPETMEGLVRQVLKAPNQPALILFFMCDKKGGNEQAKHALIGKHYNLSMVSFRDALFPEIEAGNIKWESIEADDVHPNDNGHRYAAQFITAFIQKVLDEMPKVPKIKQLPAMPDPMTSNPFEYTTMICAKNSVPAKNQGWRTDDDKGPYRQFFGNGWLSEKPGSIFEFDIKGSFISIVYHVDKQKDYGMIQVQVDDLEPVKHNAYAGWIWDGGMCVWKPITGEFTDGWHKVKITLLEEKDKDSRGNKVRLLAVMASGKK